MKRMIVTLLATLLLAGCATTGVVVDLDEATGYFPTNVKATVVESKPMDIDSRKGLLLAPIGDFTAEMARNIGYFDEVIDFEELEKRIIAADLTDEIPTVRERIGINNAARKYGEFLWIRWDTRTEGTKRFRQLILTDPVTMDDWFITETYLDTVWAGVSDRANFYPVMNALIDYIRENSSTYGE